MLIDRALIVFLQSDLCLLLPFPDGVVDDVGVEVAAEGADEELRAVAPREHVAAVDELGHGKGEQEYHHIPAVQRSLYLFNLNQFSFRSKVLNMKKPSILSFREIRISICFDLSAIYLVFGGCATVQKQKLVKKSFIWTYEANYGLQTKYW